MTESITGVELRDLESLVHLSKISEFVEMYEFLGDDDFATMLNYALKCLANPQLHAEAARDLLVRFQSASVKFGMLAVYYTTLKKGRAGTDDNMKKNMYYTLEELCDKMAQSLKYIVRRQGE